MYLLGIVKAESPRFRYGDQKENEMIDAQVFGLSTSVDKGVLHSEMKCVEFQIPGKR